MRERRGGPGGATLRRFTALAVLTLVLVLALRPRWSAPRSRPNTRRPNDITSAEATASAAKDPNVHREQGEHPKLYPSPTFNNEKWEVGWFEDEHEYALTMVDPESGEVTQSWTGYQVAWEMARGYLGEFAHSLNSPLIWLPLCLLFLVGSVRLAAVAADREPRPAGPVRLRRLPLLLQPGEHRRLGAARLSGAGLPPRALPVDRVPGAGKGLRPVWPTLWLLVMALFLMGFRVGLNMADAGAIDVGYAGVTGAHQIVHGEQLYGDWPEDIHSGDTYGPVNYAAYIPFEVIWPYTGEWDDLPAAHGASVTFDVAHLHPADRARDADPPGAGGPPPRRDPRLRLGRFPLHRLRAGVGLQRRADLRLAGGDARAA